MHDSVDHVASRMQMARWLAGTVAVHVLAVGSSLCISMPVLTPDIDLRLFV
jgi:hypothetical protein